MSIPDTAPSAGQFRRCASSGAFGQTCRISLPIAPLTAFALAIRVLAAAILLLAFSARFCRLWLSLFIAFSWVVRVAGASTILAFRASLVTPGILFADAIVAGYPPQFSRDVDDNLGPQSRDHIWQFHFRDSAYLRLEERTPQRPPSGPPSVSQPSQVNGPVSSVSRRSLKSKCSSGHRQEISDAPPAYGTRQSCLLSAHGKQSRLLKRGSLPYPAQVRTTSSKARLARWNPTPPDRRDAIQTMHFELRGLPKSDCQSATKSLDTAIPRRCRGLSGSP